MDGRVGFAETQNHSILKTCFQLLENVLSIDVQNESFRLEAEIPTPTPAVHFSIVIIIINLSHKDRGHTKGEPVLGAPPYKRKYTQNIGVGA